MTRSEIIAARNLRNAREAEHRRQLDAARLAIRMGRPRDWVVQQFNLSATNYERLAAQVQAGAMGSAAS